MFTNSKLVAARIRRATRKRGPQHSLFRSLRIEPLEDRRVLSGITYSDFSDPSGLNLMNNAQIAEGNILRLTPAVGGMEGAAWYTDDKPYVSVDWETTFEFNLNENQDSPGGSDGFVFIVQNHAPTYLRGGGGTLGYFELPNSLAVEFDTFQNSEANDPSQSHISIHTNGTDKNSWEESLSLGSYDTPKIIDDAATHTAKVSYTPGSLRVFLDDLVTPVLGVSVDLEETLDLDRGRAWVGFTATTGGGWQNHDILSWQFTSLADTTPVIVASDVEVLEGDSGQSNANFDVTVTRPDDTDPLTVTVDYATADDTATAGSDYLSANGSLVFELSVGQTEMTKTVSVPINGDPLLEDSEQFTLNLSNVQAATIAVSPGTATIVTDDISVSIEDVQVVEGELQGVFMDVFAPVSGITGAMDLPRDFAFHDTDGFVYATSAASNEILRYDGETGEFHDIFISAETEKLSHPIAVAFGPHDDHLYVANWGTGEITKFDGVDGTFINTFISDDRIERAANLLFDEDGSLFVSNHGANEVLQYSALDGSFIKVAVAADSGIRGPSGMVLQNDQLYICSSGNNMVYRYDGTSAEVFVTSGSGGLSTPWDVDFAADGNLLVASVYSHEVLKFNLVDGSYVEPFVPQLRGGLMYPANLVATADGLFVSSSSNDSIIQYDVQTGAFIDTLVISPRLQAPKGVTFGPDGDLYVANWFGSTINRYDGQTGEFVQTLVEPHEDALWKAVDLAFGPDENLYVAMVDQSSILRYNGTTGAFMGAFTPTDEGLLSRPNGLTFSNGKLYVSSSAANSVLQYDATTGAYLGEFVASGSGGISEPRGITFGPDGNLYVLSTNRGKVFRYDGVTGAFMDVFAHGGNPDNPHYLTFSSDGAHLYVSSYSDHRVLHYDGASGQYLNDIVPAALGGLFQPCGIAVGSDGRLYVAHDGVGWTNQVLRYDPVPHAAVPVTLSNPSPVPITIDYWTVDNTATAGSDYQLTTGTLTFEPGETIKSIIVPTMDDALAEHVEAFGVELDSESVTDATVIDSSAVATILDPLTYQSPQVPRAIPDAKNAGRPGVVTSSLDVSANGMVYDLNVNLDISHAFVSDLAVTLLAPNGALVELFSQVGGSGDNFGATRLDDQAGTPINEGNAPFKASYRPEGSLATFEHMDPSGTWTLEITDSQRGNSGTLNSWSLEVATYEPIPNDAPISVDDTYGVTEDNTLHVSAPGVLGNDLDDDSDALTAEIVGNVAHGALSLLVNGSLTYTPDADFSGVDSFTYRAYDGTEYSNTATVTITVNPVNDPPMAVNDQATTQRDEPVIISVLANDTDADEDPLSVSSVTQGNHGVVVINADGTLTLTPASGFVGSDTFTYTVNDGNGEEDTATVTVTVNEFEAPELHTTGPISVEIVDAHPQRGSRLTESELVIGAGDTQVTNIGSLDVELDISHSDKTQLLASLESAEGDVIVLRGSMIEPPLAAEYTGIGFVGQQLVGTWTLKLWDEVKGVVGTLNEWSITVTGASPLLSEGAREAPANDRTVLTQQDAGRIARAAMAMWNEQADWGGLAPIDFRITDLPAGQLGLAWGNTIVLDGNANGSGWFVDPTPWDHREFVASNPLVSERIDLLTVVTHELGHLLGHGHGSNEYDVMSALLSPGTRRLPEHASINSQQVMSRMVDLPPLTAFARFDRVMSDDLDDDTLNARVTAADIDMCLPYLETPDYLERWQAIQRMKGSQVINDITDEETELLDEDLLELIAGENG